MAPFITFLFIALFQTCAAAEAATSLCDINYPSDSQFEWECRKIKDGETLESLFGARWKDLAAFNRIDRKHAFKNTAIKVTKNRSDIKDFTPMPKVYDSAEKEAKFILVDLSEQFLGAYEYGQLVFSSPVATGKKEYPTPAGEFRINAFSRRHFSFKYVIENTEMPYPMNYALRFFTAENGNSLWFHGRDMPGHAASHGCLGLYDEEMQKEYYGYPKEPVLNSSRRLYEWVIGSGRDDGEFTTLHDGPRVLIVGGAP